MKLLVSDRTGIVSTPVAGPGPWPLGDEVVRYRADVGHADGRFTVAGAGWDARTARRSCVAEGVERYAATIPRTPVVLARVDDLVDRAVPHLDPVGLGVDFRPDHAIGWLMAHDGRLVPLGAAAGHLSPTAAPVRDGVYPQGSTGLAAGPDLATAEASATHEVLERDAIARAWAAHHLPRTTLEPGLAAACRRAGLVWSAHRLPVSHSRSDAALLALHEPQRGLLGVGAAHRSDLGAAMRKAFLEAVVSLGQAAELTDAQRGPAIIEAAGLGHYRSDRTYAADGWSHVRDIAAHALLLLDPALQQRVWSRLVEQPAYARARQVTELDADQAAEPPAVVDLTVPDCSGLVVVRVLAPGRRVVRPAAFTPEELPCPLV